jgi:D-amino-acid dehydrogenase
MEILVAGAGIVGVSSAIWLQRAGHRVTLVDRQAPGGGTSYGNAGVLAAGSIVPVTTTVSALGLPAQIATVSRQIHGPCQ